MRELFIRYNHITQFNLLDLGKCIYVTILFMNCVSPTKTSNLLSFCAPRELQMKIYKTNQGLQRWLSS